MKEGLTQSQFMVVEIGPVPPEADPAFDVLSGVLFEQGVQGVEHQGDTVMATFFTADSPEVLKEKLRLEVDRIEGLHATVVVRALERTDWYSHWEGAFKPIWFGSLAIIPSWAKPPVNAEHILVIDPSDVFGTGLHPTTAMCLEYWVKHPPRGHLLDVGTGTGILAAAALRWGASDAVGIDIDPRARKAALQTARSNGLMNRFEIQDVAVGAITETFETVVANLQAQPLIRLSRQLIQRVHIGGQLLVSGIRLEQTAEVRAAFEMHGGNAPHVMVRDGWVALAWKR